MTGGTCVPTCRYRTSKLVAQLASPPPTITTKPTPIQPTASSQQTTIHSQPRAIATPSHHPQTPLLGRSDIHHFNLSALAIFFFTFRPLCYSSWCCCHLRSVTHNTPSSVKANLHIRTGKTTSQARLSRATPHARAKISQIKAPICQSEHQHQCFARSSGQWSSLDARPPSSDSADAPLRFQSHFPSSLFPYSWLDQHRRATSCIRKSWLQICPSLAAKPKRGVTTLQPATTFPTGYNQQV